jgi:peptide/nickel transport system permease protein
MATIEAKYLPRTALAETRLTDRKHRSLWGDVWRKFRRHRTAMIGSGILVAFIVGTLVGPFIYTRSMSHVDFALSRLPPSLDFPFGTNDLGQDMLARALFGGRVSIAVGLMATFLSITLGILIGALAGYFGGRIDDVLMRITDLFLSLPVLPVLILTIYLFRDTLRELFGPDFGVFLLIVILIGAFNWMPVARVVRASFLSLKEKEFVEAARSIGAPTYSIIVRHILPNSLSPVIVAATLGVGSAIITESALSFLGLGFPPDFPTWGRLLFDGKDFLELAPGMSLFPGLLIFLTVLSINYVGDGLRDALDPRGLLK